MKNALLIVLGIVVLAVGGSAILFTIGPADESKTTTSSTPEQTGGTGTSDSQSATIAYTSRGFSPATVTVKSGSKVTVTNNSSDSIQPASGPHPVHTDNPEINFGEIAAGSSKTITVANPGTWELHNHDDAAKTMTIIVQ
jgi:plastocyanin